MCILFRGFDRPTVLLTEGYEWYDFSDVSDIGVNLNANVVHVEHRNYGKSYNQDNGNGTTRPVLRARQTCMTSI